MTLSQAQSYACKIAEWLSPHCLPSPAGNAMISRMAVAGSIRRARPVCNDVDLVCIPKFEEEKDLMQTVVSRKNLLAQFLDSYASKGTAKIITNGPRQLLIDLPKCQLDLWFAEEKNFATRLLCRTGSKDHNVWIAQCAKRRGWKWNSYEGILTDGKWIETAAGDDYAGGHLHQFETEEQIYAFLNLPFIEPKNRELDYLIKHFGK